MPYLKEIVTIINDELKASTLSDKRFSKGSFLGIATLLPRNEDNSNVTIPAIVSNNGDCTEVIIDDFRPFMLYHRVVDLTYNKLPSYGDNSITEEVATINCIVYFDRNIIKTEPEQIVAAFSAGLIEQLDATNKDLYNLQTCTISLGNINLNSQQVYSSEYSGDVEYKLRPNQNMASITYTITSEYSKECVDIC